MSQRESAEVLKYQFWPLPDSPLSTPPPRLHSQLFCSNQNNARQSQFPRPAKAMEGSGTDDRIPKPRLAQLRGGAAKRQVGLFRWLKKVGYREQKPDKGKGRMEPDVVTYRGREIGSPQPPAYSFATKSEDYPSLSLAPKSPLNNGYDTNGNHLPTPSRRTKHTGKRMASPPPLLPLLPATTTITQSRPATTNRFAAIYGNLDQAGAGPSSPLTDYTVVHSVVGSPSAHEGSQTGYGPTPVPPEGGPLRDGSNQATDDARESRKCQSGNSVEKGRLDRKWDKFPALPPRARAPEPLLWNKTASKQVSATITVPPPTFETTGTVAWVSKDSSRAAHNHSIRTHRWDLQSSATDDISVDNLLRREEHRVQLTTRRRTSEKQLQLHRVPDNEDCQTGLPEETASSPERVFYGELFNIVKNYHEQQWMIQRAFEVGDISEEHWKRQLWRYEVAMDKTVRAAADMAGYEILTGENDIREAIKHTTGYAIYCTLLSTRDPEKWQHILDPNSVNPRRPQSTTARQQHAPVPENSLTWLARKAGRMVRFMLAVPDDPDLKTHSSRYTRSPHKLTFGTNIDVLGPNRPSRPQDKGKARATEPLTSLYQNSASACAVRDQSCSSVLTSVPIPAWITPTIVDANSTFTGLTPSSPLNSGYHRAPRRGGYEQGAFVTVLNPLVAGSKSGSAKAGYGAGWSDKKGRAKSNGSTVTVWPEADC